VYRNSGWQPIENVPEGDIRLKKLMKTGWHGVRLSLQSLFDGR